LFAWHWAHETDAWAPVSGNTLGWLNVEGCQTLVEWHVAQVVGKPAAAWAGLVVPA
jgi:hypothetical protein